MAHFQMHFFSLFFLPNTLYVKRSEYNGGIFIVNYLKKYYQNIGRRVIYLYIMYCIQTQQYDVYYRRK